MKCKFCESEANSIDPELCCACEAARAFASHCPQNLSQCNKITLDAIAAILKHPEIGDINAKA